MPPLPRRAPLKLSGGQRIGVLVATLWPRVYMFLFVTVIFGTFLFMAAGGNKPQGPPVALLAIFPLHLLTMLLVLGLLGFYMVYLFRTDRLAEDRKLLWVVVLFMLNVFAMPVFWYLYIWPEEPPEDAAQGQPEVPPPSAA